MSNLLKVVESTKEPDKHLLWLKNNIIYKWAANGWMPLNGKGNSENNQGSTEIVTGLSTQEVFYLDLSKYNKEVFEEMKAFEELPVIYLYSNFPYFGYVSRSTDSQITIWCSRKSYENKMLKETEYIKQLYLYSDGTYKEDTIYKVWDATRSTVDNKKYLSDGGKYETVFDINLTNIKSLNLEILSSLNTTNNYSCLLEIYEIPEEESVVPQKVLSSMIGTYHNGTFVSFQDGRIVKYDVNFDTGAVSLDRSVDIDAIGYNVPLAVCTAGSEEADRNLELLTAAYTNCGDHFTVDIDGGIGVGQFIPGTGGSGHITTHTGVDVYYTFGTDGTVTKSKEVDVDSILANIETRLAALETS